MGKADDRAPRPPAPRRDDADEAAPDEAALDEASEESFPASDPPSWGPLHPGKPAKHPDSKGSKGTDRKDVVSRRDERGVRYPGDWPNPVSDLIRGCF